MNISEYQVPRDLLEGADKLLKTIDPTQFKEIEQILSITGTYLTNMQSVLSAELAKKPDYSTHPTSPNMRLFELGKLIFQHVNLQDKFSSHKDRLERRKVQLINGQLRVPIRSIRIQQYS